MLDLGTPVSQDGGNNGSNKKLPLLLKQRSSSGFILAVVTLAIFTVCFALSSPYAQASNDTECAEGQS